MSENVETGLTMPEDHYRYLDRSIKKTYGKDIGEIAQIEPAFAFQALRTGLTSLFTRKGQRGLMQQTETASQEVITKGVIDRDLDGEDAFVGATATAMDTLVDKLISRYEGSEVDFAISVVRNRSLIERLRGRDPVTEVVAVIPRNIGEVGV